MTGPIIALLLTLALAAPTAASPARADAPAGALRERTEAHQAFRLTPGARVEITGISGSVEIETGPGDIADITVVTTATDKATLTRAGVVVTATSGSLSLRGAQLERSGGDTPRGQFRHHVTIRLPRAVSLDARAIGGRLRLSEIDGDLRISSVSGPVDLRRVGGDVAITSVGGRVNIGEAAELSVSSVSGRVGIGEVRKNLTVSSVGGGVVVARVHGRAEVRKVSGVVRVDAFGGALQVAEVGGDVSAGLGRVSAGGVDISSVSGSVDLTFAGAANAWLEARTVGGGFQLEAPQVVVRDRADPGSINARLGAGGPAITVRDVSGHLRLAAGG